MSSTLSADALGEVFARLRGANLAFARRYPGESGRRQPVQVVYGGAHLFRSDSSARLGALALRALEEYAATPEDLARAIGLPEALAPTIHTRVGEKLRREPVEDFRADFEDGYGNRPDAEEDGHAESAAREMAVGAAAGTLPPFIGIRIKPFTEELRDRSVRTLDLFLTTLARETGGRLPEGFVVTLPKVTIPEQVTALADLFDLFEPALGLPAGSLRLEIMIETPQSVLNERGISNLPLLAEAARGRCVAAHFGTYDYTASSNITASWQSMTHPVCDFAKHMMKVAYAGTGLWISDGATNVLPVAPHRAAEKSATLTPAQVDENRATVHRAWRLHHDHIRHSLIGGFYQGWDLHPAQLVTRFATVFEFFLEGLDAASDRLRNFVQKAAQATLVGEVFDDAATGQGLLNYFLRAVNCGAITEEEALERSGLTLDELRGRSFVKILENRRG
ncbi:MAG TPA: phosphoenolpyruvate kinase [Thermoanaerobaculia bacterium]|nr:phosphoenolpyruvate kinase [Thermoanaerobaculia bacterium]